MRPLQIAEELTEADITADPRYDAGVCGRRHAALARRCDRCGGTGYRGRIGVFELLAITDDIRKLVNVTTDSTSIDKAAIQTA